MPQIAVYIGKSLYELLQKASKKTGKTESKIVQEALTNFIVDNFTEGKKT